MNNPEKKTIEWFLRIALSAGFLSAVADRFGLWPKEFSTWGNWDKFSAYTHTLTPFANADLSNIFAILATAAEFLLGILLLIPFKTHLVARLSGIMLLMFGFSMVIFNFIKAPLDYSVFTAAAASFALAYLVKSDKADPY